MKYQQRRSPDAPPDFGSRYDGRTLRVQVRVLTSETPDEVVSGLHLAARGPLERACFASYRASRKLTAEELAEVGEPEAKLLECIAMVNTPERADEVGARVCAWLDTTRALTSQVKVELMDEKEARESWAQFRMLTDAHRSETIRQGPNMFRLQVPLKGKGVS